MAKGNTVEIVLSAKDRASKTVEKSLGTVRTATASALSVMAKGAVAAGAALATLSGVVGKVGIGYNAMMEQSEVAWKTLLGSQGEALKMLEDINNFAKATPFETSEVDMMAKYMHNAGLEGKALFDSLMKVSDVASAFAIPASEAKEMTRQMSQVRQAGVAYTEDLNILQDRGVPIFKAIAEQMGINVADVKKMASEGKVSSDIYVAAFDSIAKGVTGASEAQSKTFNGMISTLKDNLSMISGELMSGAFDRMKGALEKVMPVLDTFLENLQNGGIKEAILGLFPPSFAEKASKFAGIAQNVFDTVKNMVLGYVENVKNLFNGEGNLGQSFTRIFEAIKSIALPILQDAISFIKGILANLKQFWDENGAQIIQAVKNAWSFIASIFEFFAPVVLFILKTLWTNVKGVIDGALKIIMGLIKVFTGIFTGDWSKFWEGIKQLIGGALQFIWNLFNLMMIGKLIGGIKSFIASGIGFFKSFGSAITGTIKGMVDDVITWFSYFRQTGASIWQSLVSVVQNIVQIFKTNITSNFSSIWTTVKTIFGRIKDAIVNPIQTAKNTVYGFIQDIKGFFRNMSVKIKMPHFKVSNFSLNPKDWVTKGLPKLSVDWYDKGGVFYGPQVIGVGEKRPEFVGALDDLRAIIADVFTNILNRYSGSGTGFQGRIEIPVYLDGYEMARAVYPHIDEMQGDEISKNIQFNGW